MGILKTRCFVVFLVLLCALMMVESLGSRENPEGNFMPLEIDEGMAEMLWNYCGPDLIRMKEAIGDLDLCIPGEPLCNMDDIISQSPILSKVNMQKTMSTRHPILKQTLMTCFIKKHFLVHIYGKHVKKSNIKYLESMFLNHDALRRVLLQSGTGSPSSAPAPTVQSPTFSPEPSAQPGPSPAPAPTRLQSPPAKSPASSFFTPDSNISLQDPSGGGISPTSNSSAPVTNKHSSGKAVAIAVGATASVTSLLLLFLFLCYTKVWKKGHRKNDQSPLLGLSDSVGSSRRPFVGNSVNKENMSYDLYPTQNQNVSNLNGNLPVKQTYALGSIGTAAKYYVDPIELSSSITSQAPNPPLKPPPGRVTNTPPAMPTSKPALNVANPPPPVPDAPVPPPSPLKPSGGAVPPPPGPPPPGPPPLPSKPPGINSGPRPPPPPKSGLAAPRPPPPMGLGSKPGGRPPPGPNRPSNIASVDASDEPTKAKLKPFFWDKVMANPDQSMVWDQIKSGSFQFNEEMIETLFGTAPIEKNKNDNKNGSSSSSQEKPPQFIQIIDSKKAQNLSILLRALNVTTDEVFDALQEGNELPVEFLQTLMKMAPTSEEELKLRLFNGDLSQLGPADRFLKTLVEIPFAFKRLESLLFMSSLPEEVSNTKESFATLEVACKELRNSRLFLKLLEAVLKTGNRMNTGTFRGGAQAFKLDTLLKLSDVKGTDGKTTLLHFVVQEIIRYEGIRAARGATASQSMTSVKSDELVEDSSSHEAEEEKYRSLGLEVVSGLCRELENVKKAANVDFDSVSATLGKLGQALVKSRDFLNSEIAREEEKEDGFRKTLKSFVQNAEIDIKWLSEEEKRIMGLVKNTGDYFHGSAGKDDGLRLFVIVRDFLVMLDRTCKAIRDSSSSKKTTTTKVPKKEVSVTPSSSSSDLLPQQGSLSDIRLRLFPAIADRRIDSSSSDDDE